MHNSANYHPKLKLLFSFMLLFINIHQPYTFPHFFDLQTGTEKILHWDYTSPKHLSVNKYSPLLSVMLIEYQNIHPNLQCEI